MTINKLIVGADLSRPSPIYRPPWILRYPDYFVHLHYRPSVHLIDNLIILLNLIIAPGKRNSAIQGVQ